MKELACSQAVQQPLAHQIVTMCNHVKLYSSWINNEVGIQRNMCPKCTNMDSTSAGSVLEAWGSDTVMMVDSSASDTEALPALSLPGPPCARPACIASAMHHTQFCMPCTAGVLVVQMDVL